MGVVDRPSVWRLGVVAALESARFAVTHAERVAAVGDVDVVLVIVDVPADEVPAVVDEVGGGAAVVALLTDPSASNHADALTAGADGVAGCDASGRLIGSVVAAAAAGTVLLSVEVART